MQSPSSAHSSSVGVADEKGLASEKLTEVVYHEEIDTSAIDEKKLLRKIDIALIPWLSFLYLLSFLDRTSIGNARLYKLEPDLHINDNQYNLALTIFFISYSLFEVPSNVFLKRLRPSVWLSFLMFMWGIMMMLQGFVTNFGGLLGMRWLLGVFEAGLYPGVSYYLSCWYRRSEYGIRIAFFFSAATVSGAFGGLLAAAISNMEGVGGKPAWAWIFIIEGLVTIVAGFASFWIIQDFPDTAKFLTEPERAFIVRRLQQDDQFSAAGETLRFKNIWRAVSDWKTWVSMGIFGGIDGALYAFALFLPTIINKLGFTANPANLLTVPVYVVACIWTCTVGYFADRTGNRGWFNIGSLSLGFVGYLILVNSRSAPLSYFAVFLGAMGIYASVANTTAWQSNNIEGSYKRAVCLAMMIGFGNMNGAVTSNVYRGKDKPWFTLGHGIVLMYIGIGLSSSIAMKILLRRENAKRDRGERDEIIRGINDENHVDSGWKETRFSRHKPIYENLEDVKQEKGDEWSGFRYTT